MKLVLHIGKNKVGSSTLQSFLCTHNSYLLKQKIYYPLHKTPESKYYGSVGNALDLTFALKYKFWIYIKSLLNNYYNISVKNDYNVVILSNESLFHNILNKSVLSKFLDIIKNCGFDSCHFLIFDKNQFEHSVSCYNHRVGSSVFVPYEDWIKNNKYEGYLENLKFKSIIDSFNNNFLTITNFMNTKDVVCNFLNIFGLNLSQTQIEHKNKSISIEHGFIIGKISLKRKFFAAFLKIYLKQNNNAKISNINAFKILESYQRIYSCNISVVNDANLCKKNLKINNNYINIYNLPTCYISIFKTIFVLLKYYIFKIQFLFNSYNYVFLIVRYFKLLFKNS